MSAVLNIDADKHILIGQVSFRRRSADVVMS